MLTSQINEFINMVNILADITVYCVKNKVKLSRFNWRSSVYFIYERFLHERNLLFKNILNNDIKKIVRSHHELNQQSAQLWANSQHRKDLITQI